MEEEEVGFYVFRVGKAPTIFWKKQYQCLKILNAIITTLFHEQSPSLCTSIN